MVCRETSSRSASSPCDQAFAFAQFAQAVHRAGLTGSAGGTILAMP